MGQAAAMPKKIAPVVVALACGLGAAVPCPADAPGAGGARSGEGRAGLHLERRQAVSFSGGYHVLTDGGGYRWDFQYYGNVYQGTNYAYCGGLYCQVNGNNVMAQGNAGWANKDGDEFEIGPWANSDLRIWRRAKVFKDQALARWLEIFENPTASDVTIPIQIYTNTNWTIIEQVFASGKGSFDDADECFITRTQGGSAPAVFHYVADRKAKVRPTITVQGNQIYVRYSLTVPPRQTVVLCHFESQNTSVDDLKKLMKSFRPAKAMRDLPAGIRKLIVNIPAGSTLGTVELERSEGSDTLINRHGDPIYGTVNNASFELDTYFGRMTLAAKDIIGMAAVGGEEHRFQVLLAGGQTLAGGAGAEAKVALSLPSGGKLAVPLADVQQWSYRISKDRPEDADFASPVLLLRTGDCVAFDGAAAALKLRTRHGTVDLKAADLHQIALDNAGNAVHRVTFLNGSRLAGFLEPAAIPVALKLGAKLTVPRDLLVRVQYTEEEKPDPSLDAVSLSNGDELFGRLAAEELALKTDYGTVALSPENIQTISFSATHVGRAVVQLWDGSVLRGQCGQEFLAFQIEPGPRLSIHAGQLAAIRRSSALPPKEVRQKLAKLIGKLGAESYKDRQAATEELVRMGRGIVPMLRGHLTTSDPEVRQRIQEVIERLGGGDAAPRPQPVIQPGCDFMPMIQCG